MKEAALKSLRFLSHGTLESRDLEKSRQFYAECLGLDVIRTSPVSLMIKLGGNNTIAVVHVKKKEEMSLLNHNGLDVATREEVDECHRILKEQQEKWGIRKVTHPADQHGTYAFYFLDPDDNWWEILTNPEGGYSWMFGQGGDLEQWGAGEHDAGNPNDYRGKPRKART